MLSFYYNFIVRDFLATLLNLSPLHKSSQLPYDDVGNGAAHGFLTVLAVVPYFITLNLFVAHNRADTDFTFTLWQQHRRNN
jgi:hypothetical protein